MQELQQQPDHYFDFHDFPTMSAEPLQLIPNRDRPFQIAPLAHIGPIEHNLCVKIPSSISHTEQPADISPYFVFMKRNIKKESILHPADILSG
jgi:hypothetical protein